MRTSAFLSTGQEILGFSRASTDGGDNGEAGHQAATGERVLSP